MNKNELKKILLKNNVSSNSYSLEGGLPNEKYCIDFDSGKWIVYYSERGVRSGLEKFNTENDACVRLKNILIQDATTRS